MSELDQLVRKIEQTEADEEMYFSLLSIPYYYQPQEETY